VARGSTVLVRGAAEDAAAAVTEVETEHAGGVVDLAWSPRLNGTGGSSPGGGRDALLATAGGDRRVRLWRV